MSVPADRLNQLRASSVSLHGLNEIRPAAADAANAERIHIAEDLLPDTGLSRTRFVEVSNLHQGDALRSQFTRVPLSKEQIKEDLGEGLYELFDFQQPVLTKDDEEALARGDKLSSNATNRLHIPEALSKDKLKHDYKFQSDAYQYLHKELNQSDAVQEERGKRSLFEKFKNFFVGDDRDRLNVAVEGRAPNADKVNVKLAIDGKEISNKATLHHRENFSDKSGIGWRKTAYALGTGALLVGGGALIAAAAIGLVASVAAFGGVLVVAGGLGLGYKAAFGKHPWWGKTVTGQLQKAEREHARVLADGIAEQVKATMMVDAGKRNVDIPGSEFQARHILKDAEALQNFIRLAKDKNSSRLYNDIRAKLLQEASSPLSTDTITRANKKYNPLKFWTYAFKGQQGKHANKTVDIYAKELTMGIMRGVNEAYVQSLIGELSDSATNKAQNKLVEILGRDGNGLMAQATDALKFLNPENNADRFPIAQPEDHIRALQAMLGEQIVGPEAGTVDGAIKLIKNAEDILGEVNTRNLSEALGTLKSDLEKHIASLKNVNQLLSKRGQNAVSLDEINNKLVELLTNEFDSADEARLATKALDDELSRLMARINDEKDPDARKLVKAHAEQLVALLGEVRSAIKGAGESKATVAGAGDAFRREDLTLAGFRTQASQLRELKQMPNLDPSGRGGKGVLDAMGAAQQERSALLESCNALDTAGKRADEIQTLRNTTVALAYDGNLQAALEREADIADRDHDYQRLTKQWTDSGFTVPSDLSAMDVVQWKRDVTAAYLKLDAPTNDLAPVLDRLIAGNRDALPVLRRLSDELGPDATRSLLTELQKTLSAPDADGPTLAQNALTALRHLDNSIVDDDGIAAATIAKTLHTGQANLIDTYRAVKALDQASRNAMRSIGAELAQVNAEAADGQRVDSDDDASNFLQQLAKFCENHAETLQPDDLATLKTCAGKFVESADNFATWGANAQRITEFKLDQVTRLLTIFNGLIEESDPLRTAITQANEIRLAKLAVAQTLANDLAEGAQNSKSEQLRAAVQLAAAPKEGVSRAELESVAQQLLEAYVAQSNSASDGRLNDADLKVLAEQLVTRLGFKGTADELIQRIANQPAVQRLLRRHITAHLELAKVTQQSLPPLTVDLTEEERLTSARTLAGFAKARNSALEDFAAHGKQALKARIDARDQLSARFKKSDGVALDDKQLARKLRNAQTREAVERFALEDRVFSFLKEATRTEASIKNIRIAVEESGAAVEDATANLQLLRTQALNHASHITGYIEQGIRKRLDAIKALVDSGLYDGIPMPDQSGSWNPKVAYLATEIERLHAQLGSLGKVAEALQNPSEHDLAAVGRMIRETDAVTNQPQEAIKLAYIKAQQKETAKALKYFNVRNFSVQSPGWGFLGQLYFRLFNQNEAKLNRVVGHEEASEIADSISRIAEKYSVGDSLKTQRQQLQAEIAALEERKKAMVNNDGSVRSALVLVTLEHLAESGSDEISDSLRAVIIEDWKALLGDEFKNHAALIKEVGAFRDLQTLVGKLGVKQDVQDQIRHEYEAIRADQQKLENTGRQLREAIAKSAAEIARRKQAQTLELAQELGLDETDFVTLTALVGGSATMTMMGSWQRATESRDRGAFVEAWARASEIAMSMENTVGNNSSKASPAEQKRNLQTVRRLIDKLEREFLAELPAATPLDSLTRAGSPAERGHVLWNRAYKLASEASILGTDQQKKSAATLQTELRALEDEVKEALRSVDMLNGRITDKQPLSRRAIQRLGVETQLYLAMAMRALSRHIPAEQGMPSLDARAKYFTYNAGLIRQSLAKQPESAASAHSSKDVSTYDQSLRRLDRELKSWLKPGEVERELTPEKLEQLRDGATDALNMAVDGDDEFDREDMALNSNLTSAMIGRQGDSTEAKKPGFLKKIFGIK